MAGIYGSGILCDCLGSVPEALTSSSGPTSDEPELETMISRPRVTKHAYVVLLLTAPVLDPAPVVSAPSQPQQRQPPRLPPQGAVLTCTQHRLEGLHTTRGLYRTFSNPPQILSQTAGGLSSNRVV